MLAIGLTGPMGSGKGLAIEILEELGFVAVSTSDEVRKEATHRNLDHSRENLQRVGNSMREEHGNNIFAVRVGETIDEMRESGRGDKVVVDGIRNPGEIQWLKENYKIFMLGIIASPETRFERIQDRARAADPTTFESFLKLERSEGGVAQIENKSQVEACLDLADTKIENNGSVEEFKQKLQEVLQEMV